MFERLSALLITAALALPLAAQAPATGEVTRIDRAQSRITLKHGEIKPLDMPAMTMVFRVKDAKLLEGLNVGDKVRFEAQKIDGYYFVTQIAPQPR
jgi:Cu/Ag efflux protein CusF